MTPKSEGNDRKLSPWVRRSLARAAKLLTPGSPEEFRAACDAEAAGIDAERDQK